MDLEQFITMLRYTLSRPPAAAGKRLRSERELASIFDLGEAQIRKVMSSLVTQGVLLRKRGSGTFIRRVAEFDQVLPAESLAEMQDHAELFFAESPLVFSKSKGAAFEKPQLHVGLWCDIGRHSLVDQFIIGALSSAISAAGHRFSIHNIVKDYNTNERMTVGELRSQMHNHPCDGYLVVDTIAESFEQAIGDRRIPVVYFIGGTVNIEHQPVVMLDTVEALERAIRIFHQQDLTKIGIIVSERDEINPYPRDMELSAYENAMHKLGLEYRACEKASVGVGPAMASVRALLDRADPPQAIYVSDDTIMVGVAEALTLEGIVPGKDLAIISLSNKNFPLPPGHQWSRMEFDREYFTQHIADVLLRQLQCTSKDCSSLAVCANWVAGQTHFLKKDGQHTRSSSIAEIGTGNLPRFSTRI